MIIKERKVKELNKVFSVLLSITVPVLFLIVVMIKDGIVFESNDDFFISRILSGMMIGQPDFHVFYVKYWIAAPIMLLYRINPLFPWWGLFVLLMFVLSYAVVLYYSINNKPERLFIVTVAEIALTLAYYYMVERMQYTSVAMFLAVAGYSCLIMEREKTSAKIWFFVLEFLAYCLRDKSMMLVQLFGILVLSGICSAEKERVRVGLIKTVSIIVVIVLLGYFGKMIAGETTQEWKETYTFNQMRTEIFDYGTTPSYEEVKDVLDKYDISEEEWDAFARYVHFDWEMNPDLSKDLQKKVKEIRPRTSIPKAFGKAVAYSVTDKYARPVCLMFVFAVGFMFLLVKLRYLRVLIGFLVAHFTAWSYLFYRGRIVERVSVPLLFSECLFLLFIILSMTEVGKVFAKKKTIKIIIIYAALAGLIVLSFFMGRKQHRDLSTDKKVQDILTESMVELEMYCNDRQDQVFILDLNSTMYLSGNVLRKETVIPPNFRLSGGWFSCMPTFRKSITEYLDRKDEFYYIIYEDFTQEKEDRGIERYLESVSGNKGILVDRIKVSSGGIYLVYQYEKTK